MRTNRQRKKLRVGAGHILVAALALSSAILFFSVRSVRPHDNESRADHNGDAMIRNVPPSEDRGIAQPQDGRRVGPFGGNSANDASDNSTNAFHFVVSSDCTSYQRWEALTQLHSAQRVGQCGRFTWIVSGCLDEGSEKLGKGKGGAHSDILTPSSFLGLVEQHFSHLTISNDAVANSIGRSVSVARAQDAGCSAVHPHVHFTPDYSNMSVYGGPYASGKKRRGFLNRKGKIVHGSYGNNYKFNNKPNGLHHWAENFLAQDSRRDEAIVLIDPDFLFLKRFRFEESEPPALPGKPAAAKYGLGGQFLEFNLTRICDRAPHFQQFKANVCPFVSITNKDVNRYYSAGPPYVIHIQDVLSLSKRWSELVPPTYDEYPLLYAEMFAYSMAAADLGLKHNLVRGLYVGCMTHWPDTNDSREREALELSAKDYARSSLNFTEGDELGAPSCFMQPLSPPPFLHYCARYSFATPYLAMNGSNGNVTYRWFAKRNVDDDILGCSSPILEPYISQKPQKMEGGSKEWNVLAICTIIRAINMAQRNGCKVQTNQNDLIRM